MWIIIALIYLLGILIIVATVETLEDKIEEEILYIKEDIEWLEDKLNKVETKLDEYIREENWKNFLY